jgi:hypothetical protein
MTLRRKGGEVGECWVDGIGAHAKTLRRKGWKWVNVGWMVLGLTQRRKDAKGGSVDGVGWVGMVLLFSLRLGVLSGAGVRIMTLPPETETSVASIRVCASSRPRVFVSRQ